MTGPLLLHLASALVLAQSAPTANHSWIADVKANRASLAAKEVRVEGLVVDIRSTASEARRGLYRLIDESDREGVLIRTNQLPADGGAYRVRTLVAARQPDDGSLLLEEISRTQTDKRSSLPIVIVVLSAIALVVLTVLTIRAVREERQHLVSPPLWLLPNAGPYGKGAAPAGQPTLTYDADLEEADRRQRERLKARRRTLLRALAVAAVTLSASGAWLVAGTPSSSPVPAFILIDANEVVAVPPPPAPTLDTLFADRPIEQRFDSVLSTAPVRRDTVQRRPPTTVVLSPNRRIDTTPARGNPVQRPEVITPPAPAPTPSPVPAPVPPPPAPAPASPVPLSPEEELRLATGVAAEGIGRIISAINSKKLTELLVLVPEEMAGDAGRLERFVDLVKGFAPRATLGTVEPLTLADDRGEARFTVSFSWRGDFGVERRKTGRFTGVVRRQEGGWRFDGARLLDAIP